MTSSRLPPSTIRARNPFPSRSNHASPRMARPTSRRPATARSPTRLQAPSGRHRVGPAVSIDPENLTTGDGCPRDAALHAASRTVLRRARGVLPGPAPWNGGSRERRTLAHASWELSHTNEFLARMERFPGLFICTTNLVDTLDTAILRRFQFRVEFLPMRHEQSVEAFGAAFLRTPSITNHRPVAPRRDCVADSRSAFADTGHNLEAPPGVQKCRGALAPAAAHCVTGARVRKPAALV